MPGVMPCQEHGAAWELLTAGTRHWSQNRCGRGATHKETWRSISVIFHRLLQHFWQACGPSHLSCHWISTQACAAPGQSGMRGGLKGNGQCRGWLWVWLLPEAMVPRLLIPHTRQLATCMCSGACHLEHATKHVPQDPALSFWPHI